MYGIDKIDRDIVNLLMEDGRMPASELARRLGNVSERVVRYRIERMVQEGLIRINAIPNPRAFGLSVVADVLLEVDADSILEVANKLATLECVSYVACSIGETDVSVQLVASDTDEVYRLVTELIGKVPGVRKTTTSIVPRIIKDVYQWRIPEGVCKDGK
ncbi:MAG: Lrp/AsnC family transcriptional regulator [Anaerolineales bacterium]|nr:Lrp/AsnC family transcriptional regulator [Anaerolineales bacterium]